MSKYTFPSMTEQVTKRGGAVRQINYLHRPICDAADAYNPDDMTDTVTGLLIAVWETITAIEYIASRHIVDVDAARLALIKASRELVNEGVDVALWLEADGKVD